MHLTKNPFTNVFFKLNSTKICFIPIDFCMKSELFDFVKTVCCIF